MGNHSQRASDLFCQGYNCAQSVFAAFCEDTGMEFETALLLSSSFGGGMGRLREVCGALTGAFMAAGLLYGYSGPKDDEAKAKHYALIQELAAQFKAENQSILCRDLLGLEEGPDSPVPEQRTKAYYQRRPCAELVACAAGILERKMESGNSL